MTSTTSKLARRLAEIALQEVEMSGKDEFRCCHAYLRTIQGRKRVGE